MKKVQWWALGAENSTGVGKWRSRRQKHWWALRGLEGGSGVGTSSMDMVEGISHRPGQEGDASSCSNVKEWGCGLWTRAGKVLEPLSF